jgi:ABC-type multidrug transport system ATPase subunit
MASAPSSAGSQTAFDFQQVSVVEVSRHFGRRRALSRITLECHAGEILGLLGPNGSGKSTLLALLATILTPSTGAVRYGTADARTAGGVLRQRLGFLGHELHLYLDLSARENLALFGHLYGVGELNERIDRALVRAGLTDRADEPVSGFSRGMRQRLAIERALLHGPRMVLLDEPFTGLDATSARLLIDRLTALKHDGCLIVMATHDLDVVEGLFDRVAYLKDGRLRALAEGGTRLVEQYHRAMAGRQ